MTVDLSRAPAAAPPVLLGARTPVSADAPALARLMLDAYAGTTDDSGESLEDAQNEVAKLFAGDFGAFDAAVSLVVQRDSTLASATLVTRSKGTMGGPSGVGEAFLAFSMTAPTFKRLGLARAGLTTVMARLRDRGEHRLHLVVTRANHPAVTLYQSLGFVAVPPP